MCKFMSAIVVREPRNKGGFAILRNPATDSHSTLIGFFHLRDDDRLRFARIEFSPPTPGQLADPESYDLSIDEERTPEWFDDEMKAAVADKMRGFVRAMIATKDTPFLLGGHWIVPKGVVVRVGENTRVVMNLGTITANSGTVTANYGTVTDNYGTITANSGTITANSGTVTANYGTITANRGTVTANYGTITANRGTVTYNSGTVTDNSGTVTANYGTITANSGTITRNSGT